MYAVGLGGWLAGLVVQWLYCHFMAHLASWTAGTNCASTRSIIHFYVFFMVSEVFKSENSPKMAIFDLKWAIFDQNWNPRFSKIFASERQRQTVLVPVVSSTYISFLWYLRSLKVKIVQNGYFWPKIGHFWPKMKSKIFKNIFIRTGAKKWAITHRIIHLYAFLMGPEVFKS